MTAAIVPRGRPRWGRVVKRLATGVAIAVPAAIARSSGISVPSGKGDWLVGER